LKKTIPNKEEVSVKSKYLAGLAVGLFFIGTVASVQALPLINGNFDMLDGTVGNMDGTVGNIYGYALEDLTGTQWDVFNSLPGWTKGDGTAGIEIQRNTIIDAYSGDYYVELDSHSKDSDVTNSSMYQEVNLSPGDYELSFMYHARTNGDDDDNGIKVSLGFTDGSSLDLVSVSGTYNDFGPGWIEVVRTFTVGAGPDDSSSLYRLMFAAYGDENSVGGFIDSVEIVSAPVPEPATIILLGAMGLVGLAGSRVRKKKK